MIVCERAMELISAGLDGMTTPEEDRTLERHLETCPACRMLAEELTAIHAAFPALEEIPAPEGFAQGVMRRIRAEQPREKVIPLFRRPRFRGLVGMAACLVLCLGLYQSGWLGMTSGKTAEPVGFAAVSKTMGQTGREALVLVCDTGTVERLLGERPHWQTGGEGSTVCTLTGVQMDRLLERVQTEGLEPLARPARPLAAEASYDVILMQEK